MTNLKKTNVIVTGANGGVGYWIAYRLVDEAQKQGSLDQLDLTLACRNVNKAKQARTSILQQFPNAHVRVMELDTSLPASVKAFCDEYKKNHDHLDVLCANAGVMPIARLNFLAVLEHIVKLEIDYFFTTAGRFLEQSVGLVTKDGLGEVFATNVFGHFLMVRWLENEMSNGGRIIWSNSTSANPNYFDINDFQGFKSVLPYQSSKYAANLVSHALNLTLSEKKIYSINATPGTCLSGIATSKLPDWLIFYFAFPLLVLFRLIVPNLTVSTYNGSESVVQLANKDPQQINLNNQYVSCTGVFRKYFDESGENRYVREDPLHIKDEEALQLLWEMNKLAQKFL